MEKGGRTMLCDGPRPDVGEEEGEDQELEKLWKSGSESILHVLENLVSARTTKKLGG